MRLSMIGHSTVAIAGQGFHVLCDPWLSGRVFNEGWGLSPEPVFDRGLLDQVDHLWISHEHPDHLHFPTLKAFPDAFKHRVTVLFQETNSDKVWAALGKLGYRNFRAVPHAKAQPLGTAGASLMIYQHRHLDSALALRDESGAVINVNDAELTRTDCEKLRRAFGGFQVVLRQFSIAGSEGVAALAASQSNEVLQTLVDHHRWLGAETTIPFASFMYFCRPDNERLNSNANTALDARAALERRGLRCHLMFPGSARALDEIAAGEGDVEAFERFYAERRLAIDPPDPAVPLEALESAFRRTLAGWRSKFPEMLVDRIGAIPVRVLDHDRDYLMDFRAGTFTATQVDPVLLINSQPLHFAFSTPFGIQTLGVSGRYRMIHVPAAWKLVRILSSLYNAELYLRPRYLLSRRNIAWAWRRRDGLAGTLVQQAARFRRLTSQTAGQG